MSTDVACLVQQEARIRGIATQGPGFNALYLCWSVFTEACLLWDSVVIRCTSRLWRVGPRVLGGKAITSAGTENAAHYLQTLILHGMVISIDPAQQDCGYPPQSLRQERKVLTFVITQNWSAGRNMEEHKRETACVWNSSPWEKFSWAC